MSDVFISYSRQDKAFVEMLEKSLETYGRRRFIWVDYHSIHATRKWLDEILEGIEAAHNFVFVVSPESMASEICNRELDYALKLNKQIVPVLYETVDEEAFKRRIEGEEWEALALNHWEHLKSLQWILMRRDEDDYNEQLARAIVAIEDNRKYKEEHTNILVQAIAWNKKGRPPELLLDGRNLEAARNWLNVSREHPPFHTDLQREYVEASIIEQEKIDTQERQRIEREQTLRDTVQEMEAVIGEKEQEEQVLKQSLGRKTRIAYGLGVFALLLLVAAGVATVLGVNIFSREQERGDVLEIVSEAQQNLRHNAVNAALQSALRAVEVEPVQAQAHQVLREAAFYPYIMQQMDVASDDGDVLQLALHPESQEFVFSTAYVQGGTLSPGVIKLQKFDFAMAAQVLIQSDAVFTALAFNPHSPRRMIFGTLDGDLVEWTTDGRRTALIFAEGHIDKVNSIAFADDQNWMASASDDQTIRIWDLATNAPTQSPVQTLQGHEGSVNAVAFAPNNARRLLSASNDNSLILWNVETGEAIARLTGHENWVTSVAFNPDGTQAVSGSVDDTIILWDLTDEENPQLVRRLRGHTDTVWDVAITHDGRRIISASEDKTIRIWDIESGELLHQLGEASLGHQAGVKQIILTADDSQLISYSTDNRVVVWNIQDSSIETFIHDDANESPHETAITSLALKPESDLLLSASFDGRVVLWDIGDQREVGAAQISNGWAAVVRFSPNGRYALVGLNDGTIQRLLVDVSNREYARTLPPVVFDQSDVAHETGITDIDFASDGAFALSASGDGRLILWDVETGDGVLLPEQEKAYTAVAISNDDRYALSGTDDGRLTLWNMETRTVEEELLIGGVGSSPIRAIDFSPVNMDALVSFDDASIQKWDIESRQQVGTFAGHEDVVWAITFDSVGEYALSASKDQSVILWDVPSGEMLYRYHGHTAGISSVALSSDSSIGVSGDDTGRIIVWRIETLPNLIDWVEESHFMGVS